jgi:ABC-type polysaccharide/polyol phosphate export permease
MSNRVYEIHARKPFEPGVALNDLARGFAGTQLWAAFAWDEIQNRYRRSFFGIAWIVISFLIFVGAIALFFGGFSNLDSRNFTGYVAINYAIFLFLIANLTEGCEVFYSARTWIKSSRLPQSTYVFKSVARSLFTFTINITIAIIMLYILGIHLTPLAFLSIPAFFVILLNAVWIQTILGYIAARFRDVSHLIQASTRVLFFVTPILWVRQEAGGLRGVIADLNPFTHALEIFSAPFFGRYPEPISWIVMLSLTVAGFIGAIIVGGIGNRRLAYWL